MRRFPPSIPVLLLWLACAPLNGSSHSKDQPGPTPTEKIPVEPLGYRPPGALYMLSSRAFSSLNFMDAHHLLFTFHQSRLLHREENESQTENDQIIRAVVLEIPGGKVLETAEWRMHDKLRYLWPLGEGKFLVRQRNSYALTDASLKLHPYIEVSTPVYETEVSPDGSVIVIEHEFEKHTPEQHKRLEAQAKQFGDPPPIEDTQITLMNAATREVLAAVRTELPIHVPVTNNGYVGVTRAKGEDQFTVRFIPLEGKEAVLGKVASTCTPHENFLNKKALVIESCGPKSPDIFLDAWTTEGGKLWNATRDGRLVWPSFTYARTGDRFAQSVLRITHPIDLADSLLDEDVREQLVQVFDTATGTLLMTTNATPILTGGQNFALSEDGQRLVVLREGAIEIFDVPQPPAATGTPAPGKKN